MSIKHAFTSLIAGDGNPDKVQPADWNAAHVVDVVDFDPVSPAIGELWMVGTGTTPSRLLELKFCDTDGVVVTLVSVTR